MDRQADRCNLSTVAFRPLGDGENDRCRNRPEFVKNGGRRSNKLSRARVTRRERTQIISGEDPELKRVEPALNRKPQDDRDGDEKKQSFRLLDRLHDRRIPIPVVAFFRAVSSLAAMD